MTGLSPADELSSLAAEADLSEVETAAAEAAMADGASPAEAVAAVLEERAAPPTAETETEPAEPESGEPSRKQIQSLEREQERHERRVREIMGGFVAGFEPCGECGGVGIVPPGPKPQAHPLFKECETCAGFGQVLTGSHREGHTARDCPACLGRGYLEALDEHGAPLAPAPGAAPLGGNGAHSIAVSVDATGPSPAAPEQRFGVPSWMGDPSLSR